MSNQDPVYIWNKYFKGKGKVMTALKEEVVNPKCVITPNDREAPSKVILNQYETVTVHQKPSAQSYEKKFLVESEKYKGFIFLVSARQIEKPKKGTEAIKPQNFKMDEKALEISDIKRLVKTYVEKIDELPQLIQKYLVFLVEKTTSPNSGLMFKREHFSKIIEKDWKNIAKNFGEVLCGVAAVAQAESKSIFPKLNISKNDKIFYPRSQTEALYDFKILDGRTKKDKYLISVKAKLRGAKPNTVKPEDILKLIKKNIKGWSKDWSRTHQMKITEILAKENMRYGPLAVIKYLISTNNRLNYSKIDFSKGRLKPKAKKILEEFRTITVDGINQIIKSDQQKRTEKTSDYCKVAETYVEYISRNQIDFTDFFFAAVSKNVYFMIVTDLDASGAKFQTIGDDEKLDHKKVERIVLRGKHDLNGRMGFDI